MKVCFLDLGKLLEFGSFFLTSDSKQNLQNDFDYLMEMKAMDDEIMDEIRRGVREERKIEMSSVVPVSGLIMARFVLSFSLSHIFFFLFFFRTFFMRFEMIFFHLNEFDCELKCICDELFEGFTYMDVN